jgi:beta-galactosidase
MLRTSFNSDWVVSSGSESIMDLFVGGAKEKSVVTLPHDAMIHEQRTPETNNTSQTGFYPGNIYTYIKRFHAPLEWREKAVILEFEGVANYARVYINGEYAGGHPHAYSNFYVNAEPFLRFGESNEIKVVANNIEQTNRWYNGGGLYRPVYIMVGGAVRLDVDGLQITTPDVSSNFATIEIKTTVLNTGMLKKKVSIETRLIDSNGNEVGMDTIPLTANGGKEIITNQRITISNPSLWDAEHPYLYTCHVKVLENDASAGLSLLDEDMSTFGIRTLMLSAQTGLLINGKPVKLRGACIHHDNGILGAATFACAEERRCEQLKAVGFNSIRSAHHPISKAMLNACDRFGIYVMDELSDMWTKPKNPNDYAMFFNDYWSKDTELMVRKDFNHPSVIIYSTGNEIQEVATSKGVELNRDIYTKIKSMDSSRYVTNGINGLMACAERIPEIMEQITGMNVQEMSKMTLPNNEQEQNAGGADMLNGMTSIMTGPLADAFAVHPILMEAIDEFVSVLDIAGYNYLTALHEAEKQLHPNRVVVGTETFPADIVKLWKIVMSNNHVIGDFTWTGYDYLGEAGCGIYHYDGTQNFTSHWPDRLAYIGDIDITGYRRPISYLREIVYGLRTEPYIAVQRLNHCDEKVSLTPWMWKDVIACWTWPGYEGKSALVEVYGNGDEVELLLNGASLGKKSVKDSYVVEYEVPYTAGHLRAINRKNGIVIGEYCLETAELEVELNIAANRKSMPANVNELAFIEITLEDKKGRKNLNAQKTIHISVEGAGTLQGFGSADPQALNNYNDVEWDTYDGRLLAVIRASNSPGLINVKVESDGCESKAIEIMVV